MSVSGGVLGVLATACLMVAIWFNNDTGDSWEWTGAPEYPERYSALGTRMAVNHVVYAMTH